MKITFYYKHSERIGYKFRLALVRAYAAKIANIIQHNELSEKVKIELEKTNELKVYLFNVGDNSAKNKPDEIHFKHFTVPSLFLKTKLSSDLYPIEMYPQFYILGQFKNDCVELTDLDKNRDNYPVYYESLFRFPNSEFKTIYSVEISLSEKKKTVELYSNDQPTSYLSHHQFPLEVFLQVTKYLPDAKITVTKNAVMHAFETAIDKEVKRLENKGNSQKATRLKNAKNRALQATQENDSLANSFDSLYTLKVAGQESVEAAAQSALIEIGRDYLYPFQQSFFSTCNSLSNFLKTKKPPTLEKFFTQKKLNKKQKKLEQICEKYNPITNTEANLLLAREKINERNPPSSGWGML